jgi:cytidylate kinase
MAVVTISRQFGSGGTEVARRVCEALGYRYLDKLLMSQVAVEVGLSGKELVDFSEEHFKVRNFLERLFLPGPHTTARFSVRSQDAAGAQTIDVVQLDDARSASLVRSAIHTAYQQGNVVIVGRGGQATLQDMPGVLHVRIEAPMAARVLRIQERERIVAEEARKMALHQDQVSGQFLKTLFAIRWDDSSLYHLIINTGKWELESAAQIIVNAVERLPVK